MGQLLSSEEEYSQVKDAIGSVLYNAMMEAGAVPDLGVVHPLLLANHNESSDSRTRLQEQLRQLQGDIGNRAPAYLKDLIGRLTTFSDEPRLAGLVGLVVTLVMDMAYSSSRRSLGVKGKSVTSSSCQERVGGVQEVMEEYLKRCRINLSNKKRLFEDSVRLEGQLSLTLTQLKTCMLREDCDSRSLRHWASGAVFHIQLLVHLSALEGLNEPLVAREALEQYKEDLTEIIPVYRRYKSNTVCVMKCRGGLPASCDPDEVPEEGSVTGITVTDSETGKSVTLPLNAVETGTGRRRGVSGPGNTVMPSSINLDLITSDQYTQAYLDYLFSDKGPVAELGSYFNKTLDNLQTLRTQPGCAEETGVREQSDGEQELGIHAKEQREDGAKSNKQDGMEASGRQEETEEFIQRDESLKLSITETKPESKCQISSQES